MTAVIAWLTFLAVAGTPAYERDTYQGSPKTLVGYPGHLVPAPLELARHYLDVSWLESGHDDSVVGLDGEKCHMQIHPTHIERVKRLGHTWQNIIEPWRCLDVALDIYNEQGWRPWSTAWLLGIVQ